MSVATVKAHVSRLLAKLDVENRVQIALLVQDATGGRASAGTGSRCSAGAGRVRLAALARHHRAGHADARHDRRGLHGRRGS